MAELKLAVKDLALAATNDVDPKVLRPKVEAVLTAFDGASESAQLAAVKAIGAALGKASGRGAQVLALALGAMVEEGAPADAAWPAAAKGLAQLLEEATAFGHAAVNAAGTEDLESALESHGAAIASRMPAGGAAWKSMGARCLAAVACLARSKAVRAKARKDPDLSRAAWSLSDAIGEVGALLQALRVLDDVTIRVIDPKAKKGWKLAVDGIASNAELYLFAAEAMGAKVDAKVLAALRAGEPPKKKSVTLPFTLGIDPEDFPDEGASDQILVVGPGKTAIDLEHFPILAGLAPEARVAGTLTAAAVAKATQPR